MHMEVLHKLQRALTQSALLVEGKKAALDNIQKRNVLRLSGVHSTIKMTK